MWPIPMMTLTRYFLVGLAACLALSLVLLNRAWTEVAEKTAVIDSMRQIAEQYDERSTQIAKETSDAFNTLLVQIKDKDLALNNAKKRFGNAACGIRANGLQLPTSAGQADIPESIGGVSEPQYFPVSAEFVNGCATDAAFVGAVQSWRIANDLPVGN
jgi:hypothetical protein